MGLPSRLFRADCKWRDTLSIFNILRTALPVDGSSIPADLVVIATGIRAALQQGLYRAPCFRIHPSAIYIVLVYWRRGRPPQAGEKPTEGYDPAEGPL